MFRGLFLRWVVTSLAILMVPSLVSGVRVESVGSALGAAAILGVLNLLVKPILILFTLPLTLVTFGFFLLILNALIFQLVGALVGGIVVESFWSAFFAALLVSLVTWILNLGMESRGGRRVFYVRRTTAGPRSPGRTIDLEKEGDHWQ